MGISVRWEITEVRTRENGLQRQKAVRRRLAAIFAAAALAGGILAGTAGLLQWGGFEIGGVQFHGVEILPRAH